MVTSASVSIASRTPVSRSIYLERQLLHDAHRRRLCRRLVFSIPRAHRAQRSVPVLAVAIGPAARRAHSRARARGHGSRRWLRLAGVKLQVSELARCWCWWTSPVTTVRRETQLRESVADSASRWGCFVCVSALLLLEPDFGAATVLFATGFALLFLAGARLRLRDRHDRDRGGGLCSAGGQRQLSAAPTDRVSRFRGRTPTTAASAHPVADRIGRGQWLGRGTRRQIQKLFYLRKRTRLSCSRAGRGAGAAGVGADAGPVLGLVWRSFSHRATGLASRTQSSKPACGGFGLWVGIQAFINIGVNMGVLPTKGLTLPLRATAARPDVGLAWVGLVLRVYHEALREQRGSAHGAGRGP